MIKNTNYIFSDESGSWSLRTENYYVRVWLKIEFFEYQRLKSEFNKVKKLKSLNFKELKFTNKGIIENNEELLDSINKAKFEIRITFSRVGEFYQRKFIAKEKICEYVKNIQFDKEYLKSLPKIIEEKINYILWLNIYEKFHIENGLSGLANNEYSEKNILIIDAPQFIKKDYKNLLATYLNNLEVEIQFGNSENHLGIQICDLFCGYFKSFLINPNKAGSQKFLEKYLMEKLNFSYSNCISGINKVMWNSLTDNESEVIKKIKKLKSALKAII